MIRNERIKLLANAFDRASTAFLAAGVLTPAAGFLSGMIRLDAWRFPAAGYVWVSVAVGLPLLARRVLGGLR